MLIGATVILASDRDPGAAACTLTAVASAIVSVLVAGGARWSNKERTPLASTSRRTTAIRPMRRMAKDLAAGRTGPTHS